MRNEAVEVTMNSTLSTKKLSRTTVQRILRRNKWHLHKIQLLQELNGADNDGRL